VSIQAQPAGLTCGCANSSGLASASGYGGAITNVNISCALTPVPPVLVGLAPSYGAANILCTSQMALAFNTALMLSTINSANIAVTNWYGAQVAGSLTYNSSTNTVGFVPYPGQLAPLSTYYVRVNTGLRSASGASLASPYQSYFTTGMY
jgi:hypothetical protein